MIGTKAVTFQDEYVKEKSHRRLKFVSVCSVMIEVILNDRLGKKIRVKCNADDTIGMPRPSFYRSYRSVLLSI